MKKPLGLSLVLALAPWTTAPASEGRIPLLSLPGPPYVISQPGHYLLTRDATAGAGHTVVIETGAVTLDLGGHTIYGAGYATILVTAPFTSQPITIRNGRIAFGTQGILAGGDRNVYRFEGLDIFGSLNGIVVAADQAEILDCHVHDLAAGGPALGAIDVDAYGGRVVGNMIQNVPGGGLVAGGFRAGEIRRNVVRNYGGSVTAGAGIFLKGSFTPGLSGGAIVADNTASSLPSGTDDTGIRVDSFGTLIEGNVASVSARRGSGAPTSKATRCRETAAAA